MEQELAHYPDPDLPWHAIDHLMSQIERLQAQRKHLQHDIEPIDQQLKLREQQLGSAWKAYRAAGGRGP